MEKQYHIDCCPEDIGQYVLLLVLRTESRLSPLTFDNAKEAARKREYVTYTGTLNGTKVSVTSTGIVIPPRLSR